METNEMVFKRNLSAITGDGSFVKLDLADPTAQEKRLRLLADQGRNPKSFGSAVFIYYCNVLDQHVISKDYAKRKGLICLLANGLTMLYFLETGIGAVKDDAVFHGKMRDELIFGLTEYLNHEPSYEQLEWLRSDFDRLYGVMRSL